MMDKNEIFSLWIPDNGEKKLSELAYLSLKSFLLCDYDVILYTYEYLENVPNGICVKDANEILDSSKIFRYKGGFKTYSGFANLFRYKRLYEYGGTWLDLDVLLIKRLSDENIIICSQTQEDIYSSPNNAILRFPAKDSLVKTMLDFAEKRGSDVTHGETGPLLVRKMLNTSFVEYNKFLKHFNYSNVVNWNDVNDYLKSPETFFNNLNSEEIFGFHLFNTFFKKIEEFPDESLYTILKNIILNSSSSEEYNANLIKFNIINSEKIDNIINLDLRYLNILKDNFIKNNVKYTFLIDSRTLKKVEIYNIIHSIFNSYSLEFDKNSLISDIQIFIFGKTDIGNDNIKFKDNIIVLASDFNNIKNYLDDYIFGEFIVPINKPVIFQRDFFKDKNIKSDIEHHVLNKSNSYLNIFNLYAYKLCLFALGNIFNLPITTFRNVDFKINVVKDSLIYDCTYSNTDIIKLISLIDECDSNSFLEVKLELLKFDIKKFMQHISYHYFSSYENIISSRDYIEFNLKEYNTKLHCLNAFYLNKINPKYGF